MAFKIKSAKIFFFGIKEHTVMLLLLVVLSYLSRQTGPLQEVNRKRKLGVVVPLSCESRQATDKGHTGRDSCPSPGEGVAQGGRVQPREDKGPPRWCDCVQDFLVNFNVCDRGSPWSLPQPRVAVCVDSLMEEAGQYCSADQQSSYGQCPSVLHTHTPTHTHWTMTAPLFPLHVLCSVASGGVIIPVCPPYRLCPPET